MALVFFVEFIAYIFADLRNRSDLAFAWMYQEYANMQGYNVFSVAPDKQSSVAYDDCLTLLLTGLLLRPDHKEGSVVKCLITIKSVVYICNALLDTVVRFTVASKFGAN